MAALFTDNFSDTNGVELDAHTPDVNVPTGSWVLAAMDGSDTAPSVNQVEIQSNKLQISASSKGAYKELGVTDYIFETTVAFGATTGQRCGIYFRWTDKDNQYYLNLREPEDDYTLYVRTGGTQSTAVATQAHTFNTSTSYVIRIEISGSSLVVKFDGVTKITYTMLQHLTATKIGLGSRSLGANLTYDKVEVTNTPTAAAAAGDLAPGGTIALTLTGFPIAPTSILLNGVTETFSGTPTKTSATLQGPALSKFAPSQSHVGTRWNVNQVVRVAIGSFYAEDVDVKINPVLTSSSDFAARDSGTQYYPVTGAAAGDDQYAYFSSGSGTSNAASSNLTPIGAGTGVIMAYSVSGSAWLAPRTEDFVIETRVYQDGLVSSLVTSLVSDIPTGIAL